MTGTPRAEYTARLEERSAASARFSARRQALSHIRLAWFALGAGIGWWLLVSPAWSFTWIALPVAVFFVLVIAHDRASRAEREAQRAARFYEDGLARLDLDFTGRGNPGDEFADPSHPYTSHLDVFGRGSLFELLSRSQTQAGAETLAGWLGTPSPLAALGPRQQAVRELVPSLDLRCDLAVLGPDVRGAVDGSSLSRWAGEPRVLQSVALRGVAAALATTTLGTFVAGAWGDTGFSAFGLAVLVQAGFGLALRSRVSEVLGALEKPRTELALLDELLGRLEREPFEAPRLAELRAKLASSGHLPSHEVRALRRWIDLLDTRRNQLFAPLAPLLLWGTQIAFALDAWRARCGPSVPDWIDVVGELEALLDLASHAYEHPADPFPELVDSDAPVFEGRALGHPLLRDAESVRNDLELGGELGLLVVSGSNMSGKSTLLRTVGTNTVLALAGAPVRADSLRLTPLAIGATLRIQDSLADGASRFYAEITCLRRVVELLDASLPVLFLLDEILAGTNSHDRGIGATAVVRTLVERGAIGLVTTHDLALTKLVDDLAPRARNVHFQDELIEGEMVFDYRLHEGVVRKSNAIALMRAVGLDV